MLTLDRLQLAWAAGFFDGEGHTRHQQKRRRLFPLVEVSQSNNPAVLWRFWLAVGKKGKIYGPYYKAGNRGAVWMYVLSDFESVQAVLAMLWSFLSGPKREQAVTVLRDIKANRACSSESKGEN